MSIKSILLHLRIPFSFFLLPVFLFAFAISPNISGPNILLVFIVLHIFIYPASNAYNSFFDKDEKSIGGLKNPPPVTRSLYVVALIFDVIGVILSVFINYQFALMVLIYGLVSKAYSHPLIRLKKYPWRGWLVIGFFQGFFTLIMAYVGINDFYIENAFSGKTITAGILSSLILLGSYPMTQIYQHEEDKSRGDITISLKLGIKGTFVFTAICFTLAVGCFFLFFNQFYFIRLGLYFVLFLLPVLLFFNYWFFKVLKDPDHANFENTMRLNFISALMMNLFFIFFFIISSGVMNLF